MYAGASFGERIKAHRQELGLTQDELARRVGCASVTLRKIEYGDLRPSVQIAERLAMALNIPREERAEFVRLSPDRTCCRYGNRHRPRLQLWMRSAWKT